MLRAHTALAVLCCLVGLTFGCGERYSPGPTQPTAASSSPTTPVVPLPAETISRTPTGPPLVQRVTPAAGTTSGGTFIQITGTGFQPGAMVTFGGVPGRANLFDGSLNLAAPAHAAAELVDVVVTNPDGQSSRLTRAYGYVHPESLDFNGTWEGISDGPLESLVETRFTIRENTLTSFSCGSLTLNLSPPSTVANGEFSFLRPDDRVAVTGKILSEGSATGTIHIAACGPTWVAMKH